ncbi:NYN domain-containing protein [Helicobacter ailurogastricus]|uniref:NYN domain-containing protein n=1 Tax=Helicobacter ailurogastricus TaxID=1578720 RepID=UPI0022C6D5FA|nr:NYN domain-containing protein [Helicobacter ailurogastricus]GLH57548.1 NYN domain-containing protein [Helicobacter ailurogastricus]GLH59670.1 NYN domain-containing protein [Helicobacter ailurogastricus]
MPFTDKTKLIVFVDWECLRGDFEYLQKFCPEFKPPYFNYNNMHQLMAFFKAFIQPDEVLYRMYIYVSEPFVEAAARARDELKVQIEDYKRDYPKDYEGKIRRSNNVQEFNRNLTLFTDMPKEVRVGKAKILFEYVPRIEEVDKIKMESTRKQMFVRQKQVDLLLGLDMAHLVDNFYQTNQHGHILLFSRDSDFVPALEFARGQHVFKAFIGRMEKFPPFPDELKGACDGVRTLSVAQVLETIPQPKAKAYKPYTPLNNPFESLKGGHY